MTGPRFTMVGTEQDAPVCVDGVCALPSAAEPVGQARGPETSEPETSDDDRD